MAAMFQAPSGDTSGPSVTTCQGGPSPNVDDGLTSLSWLQNLNMCMTRLGAPTPPTPPASPNRSTSSSSSSTCSTNGLYVASSSLALESSCIPQNGSRNGQSSSSMSTEATKRVNGRKTLTSASTSIPNSFQLKQHHNQQQPHHNQSTQQVHHPPQASSSSSSNFPDESIDYRTNGSVKPPYSYATLICMAMKANKNKMTLNSIYKWIRENFLYYQNADPSWQNSIRHNLSLNKCFIKIPRTKDEPGKGGFWRLDPTYAETLVDGVFKKRRPGHRPPNCPASTPSRKKRKKDKSITNCENKVRCGNGQSTSTTTGINVTVTSTTSTTTTSSSPSVNEVNLSRESTIRLDNCLIRDSVANVQETPPSSAESYTTVLDAGQCETIELVNAVNSIDGSLHPCVSNCQYPTYGITGYADEVCIQSTTAATGQSILGQENANSDICWNAILTDTDLEFVNPINYSCQVVQHESAGTQCTCDECIVGNLMTNFIP